MLLRCLGWRKRGRDVNPLSYANAFAKTDSESTGASIVETVRRRRGYCSRIRGTFGGEASAPEGHDWVAGWE